MRSKTNQLKFKQVKTSRRFAEDLCFALVCVDRKATGVIRKTWLDYEFIS